ncbi:MAG: DMT family transporter [Proteobacteria bacterium]|nr:DMT family transporter [Pseudomonadota bacterium]
MAIYFTIGRALRPRVAFGTYAAVVCAVAALVLLPVSGALGVPLLGISWKNWLFILALTIGPQSFGHNGLNYALRFLPAGVVSAFVLLEPVGAAMLAIPILKEWPTIWSGIGGAIVVVGVMAAVLAPREKVQRQ